MQLSSGILELMTCALAAVAAIVWWQGQGEQSGPRLGYIQLAYRVIFALSLVLFGGLTLYGHLVSPRPEFSGRITKLRQSHRKTRSSNFELSDGTQTVALHCSYDGPALQVGRQLDVTYLAFDHSVLQMTLPGFQGEYPTETESDEVVWYVVVLIAGIGLGVYAFSTWRNLPDGEVLIADPDDDDRTIVSDVDDGSLLHLNGTDDD